MLAKERRLLNCHLLVCLVGFVFECYLARIVEDYLSEYQGNIKGHTTWKWNRNLLHKAITAACEILEH